MIGDVPKGAPLRCRMGRHVGQEAGGTMVYSCPRCGGSYWQEHDFRHVTAAADMLISAGLRDEALDMAHREIRKSYEEK